MSGSRAWRVGAGCCLGRRPGRWTCARFSARCCGCMPGGVRPPLAVRGQGGATEEKLVPIHGVQAYLKPAARTACASMVWATRPAVRAGSRYRACCGRPGLTGCRDAAGWVWGSGSLGVLGGPVSGALRKASPRGRHAGIGVALDVLGGARKLWQLCFHIRAHVAAFGPRVSAAPGPGREARRYAGAGRIATWLILPVVICLSQRLSHACLSITAYTGKLRMAH